MRKKLQWMAIIGICIGCMATTKYYNTIEKVSSLVELDLIQDDYYGAYEKKSLDFIKEHYVTPLGAITGDKTTETVVANELILYMTYLLEENKKKDFEKSMNYMIENMLTEDGSVGIIKEEQLVTKFSTYDQLQLFKLAYRAYDKWGEIQYKNMSVQIEEQLYKQYKQEEKLYSYYKTDTEQILDAQIPLYVLDLNGIGIMGKYRKEWIGVYNESRQIIQNSFISERFPFYNTSYNYSEKKYNKQHKANMIESMRTVLNLAQVNMHNSYTVKWLKEQLKKGALYEEYDKETGMPTNHNENPGIYGIVAQVGKVIGDVELYTLAIERMLVLQIKDEHTALSGGFKGTQQEEINLYDNLNALLAF